MAMMREGGEVDWECGDSGAGMARSWQLESGRMPFQTLDPVKNHQ